ncbi:uncharacterized protein ISCGN_011260 [Ixodes scapularis]
MDFEDVLEEIGGYGRFQKMLVWIYLAPASILMPGYFMSQIFMLSAPQHSCKVAELTDVFNLTQQEANVLHKSLVSKDNCEVFSLSAINSSLIRGFLNHGGNDSEAWFESQGLERVPCTEFTYDNTFYDSTASTQWDLVCDRSHLPSLVFTLTSVGSALGTLIFGGLSDRIGRRPAFFVTVIVAVIFGISSILVTNFIAFTVLRFVTATIMPQIFQLPYIILLELVGPKYRTSMLGIAWMAWTLGLCALPLAAYLCRTWILLGLICSACAALNFLYWKLIPESPRWLLTQNRVKEAVVLLNRIAKTNGVVPPEHLETDLMKVQKKLEEERSEAVTSTMDILRMSKIRTNFLIVTFSWRLTPTGDDDSSFFNSGSLKSVGAVVSGVVVLMLAKFSCTASAMVMYQQASEVMPTPVRSFALGASSSLASSFSICMPYIIYLAWKIMDFEDVLEEIGGYGRFQKMLVWIYLAPASILMPGYFMSQIFMLSAPQHSCKVAELTDVFNLTQQEANVLHKSLVSKDNCEVFSLSAINSSLIRGFLNHGGNDSEAWFESQGLERVPCTEFTYDNTFYDSTASTQWDLVCDRSHLPSLVFTLTSVGSALGTLIFGGLSDRIGRRPAFFVTVIVAVIFGISSILVTNFIAFTVLRFVTATIMPQIFQLPYIILLELVGPKYRTSMLGIAWMAWTLGLCALPLAAYLCRTWILLGLICSACAALNFLYWKLIPESPRWLLTQNRVKEAVVLLNRIAKTNGVVPPEHLETDLMKVQKKLEEERRLTPTGDDDSSFFNSGSLKSVGAVVSGVVVLMLAKFSCTASAMVMYQQASEVMPTPVRSFALGASSSLASSFSICMPYIIYLGKYGTWIPFMVMIVLATLAGASSMWLPETNGFALCQTMDDANEFGKDQKFFSFNSIHHTLPWLDLYGYPLVSLHPVQYTPLNPCYVRAPHYQYSRSPWYLRALVLRLISCHLTARRLLLDNAIELRVAQLSSVVEPTTQQAGLQNTSDPSLRTGASSR